MKKVLILSNSSAGLYSFRAELIAHLVKQGYQVLISAPVDTKTELLQALGCQIIGTVLHRHGMNPLQDLALLNKYVGMLKTHTPDVVLTYTVKPNIYGSLACRFTNTPFINNITGLGTAFFNQGLLTRMLSGMYRSALKKSQMVFFQNQANLNFLTGAGIVKGPCKLIPGSGVNLERFSFQPYPDASMPVTFNYIGRVAEEKGIQVYLAAARNIKQKYAQTVFNVIGFVEPTEVHLAVLLKQYEQEGWVKCWGYQTDIRPFLFNSHCTIQPSFHEGMSNVLLESGAVGRVLIASDIPGCREIIDPDSNGFLFPARDVGGLTDAIERFINLPHLEKAAMARNGRLKVENQFDRRLVIDSYMEEINKIC